jgi:hypothetical protein
VIRSGPSVYQTSHALLCRLLHQVLVEGMHAGRGGAGEIGSVPLRAGATLYALLLAHPLDQQGRCRSCCGPRVVFGRRRRCRVHLQASYWLRQPEEFLRSRLTGEGLVGPSTHSAGAARDQDSDSHAADPGGTGRQPTIAAGSPTQPVQTLALPPSPTLPAGRPGLDHGGAGDDPDGLRPRRGPSDHPGPGDSVSGESAAGGGDLP